MEVCLRIWSHGKGLLIYYCWVSALPGWSQICVPLDLDLWPWQKPRNQEGLAAFSLAPLVKMLLSFFIHRWPPNNCIPHSGLSRITHMRSSLQESIYSTRKLIKYNTASRETWEINFQKSLSTSRVGYQETGKWKCRCQGNLWRQLAPQSHWSLCSIIMVGWEATLAPHKLDSTDLLLVLGKRNPSLKDLYTWRSRQCQKPLAFLKILSKRDAIH